MDANHLMEALTLLAAGTLRADVAIQGERFHDLLSSYGKSSSGKLP